MEKNLVVYLDKTPVLKLVVTPKTTLNEIEQHLLKLYPNHQIKIYNGRERLFPYDYKKITNGKIRLVPKLIDESPLKSPLKSVQQKILTGIRDVDLTILEKLEDRDLFQFCLANKEAAKLCRDDNFWRNRFNKQFVPLGGPLSLEDKPKNMTWKEYYMKIIINFRSKPQPWNYMDQLEWGIYSNHYMGAVSIFGDVDDFHKDYLYWYLDLGKEANIILPVDRYEELPMKNLLLNSSNYGEPYLTPRRVLTEIYNFYQQPVTVEELREQQEVDNPYAEDFTEEDIEDGIKRIEFINLERAYEGFTKVDDEEYNGYLIRLGA